MPPMSFLSNFKQSRPNSYEILEHRSSDPSKPSLWSYRRVSTNSEPASSSIRVFHGQPESSLSAKAKNEELNALFDEVEQLYNAEKYSNVAFDDLPALSYAVVDRTPSPLKRHNVFPRGSAKPPPLRVTNSPSGSPEGRNYERGFLTAQVSPSKAPQRSNAVQTPPPEGPETPAPLKVFPRGTPPRKPLPATATAGSGQAGPGRTRSLPKPATLLRSQVRSTQMPPVRTSRRQKAAADARPSKDKINAGQRHDSTGDPKGESKGKGNLYDDSTKVFKANDPVKKAPVNPKRLQRSSKKKDFFADEDHLFSAKSKLSNADLNSYFQKAQAWDALTDTEKAELRSLLPADVPLDAQGRPDTEFLKYNNDWRNGVRQFQDDLKAGRYEPEWIEEAAEAMEERAAGEFDDWKEDQFEAFWGQKTKLTPKKYSTEMGKLNIEALVDAKVCEEGDIWSYARSFGRGKQAFLVEKEIKIVSIKNVLLETKLVFSMPPGQTKFPVPRKPLPPVPTSAPSLNSPFHTTKPNAATSPSPFADTRAAQPAPPLPSDSSKPSPLVTQNPTGAFELMTPPRRVDSLPAIQTQDLPSSPLSPSQSGFGSPSVRPLVLQANAYGSPTRGPRTTRTSREGTPAAQTPGRNPLRLSTGDSPTLPSSPRFSPKFPISQHFGSRRNSELPTEGTVQCTVSSLVDVERKILEVDGRLKGGRWDDRGDVWKCVRVKRGEKDLGTLFEAREKVWLRMNPYVRVPK